MITAWCFEFDNGVEKVTWAWTEIGAKDQFDVVRNLLLGIGKLIDEGIPIKDE